jgi:enoyl-[acyl-carrier protein] reductase II
VVDTLESLGTPDPALVGPGRIGDRCYAAGMLRSALTEQYGLEVPVVEAGMAFVGTPPLAIAVSKAGGMGTLGAAMVPPEGLRAMIRAVRAETDRPFGVNFITPFATSEAVDVCIEERVPVVSFHWDDPPVAYIKRLREQGVKVWMQAGTVDLARQLVDIGIDAIIAQGTEAGGHNRGTTSTLVLVPAMVDAVAPVPVLAAGGIADGRGLVAALALGAAGAWVGTRLAATMEANAHAQYKQRIVDAGVGGTTLTRIFGPEWYGVTTRSLRNRIVREWEGKPQPPPLDPQAPAIGHSQLGGQVVPMPRFSALLPTPGTEGDFEEMCMVAGESSALVHAIEPAGDVIRKMAEEAEALIQKWARVR